MGAGEALAAIDGLQAWGWSHRADGRGRLELCHLRHQRRVVHWPHSGDALREVPRRYGLDVARTKTWSTLRVTPVRPL